MRANFGGIGFVETRIEQFGKTLLGLSTVHGRSRERESGAVWNGSLIEFISSPAFALQREEDVSQLAQCAMRPNFRGASGAFEDIGHLGKGEFLKTAEQ